jgi:hypothetical protein
MIIYAAAGIDCGIKIDIIMNRISNKPYTRDAFATHLGGAL